MIDVVEELSILVGNLIVCENTIEIRSDGSFNNELRKIQIKHSIWKN